jgi:N-acetylmuramoyl-L-alanine amidase
MRVFIDIGHGGNNPGAEGNGLREEDVTQKIGRHLAAALSLYQNVETKVGPRPIGTTSRSRLQPRTDAANAWNADYLVSIHINAGGGSGYETHIQENAPHRTYKIAEDIYLEVARLFRSHGLADRGIKRSNLHMTRESRMPASLLEFGFIDNSMDASLLANLAFLQQCGEAVARGIAHAFSLRLRNTPAARPEVTDTTSPIVLTPVQLEINGIRSDITGIVLDGVSYFPVHRLGESLHMPVIWHPETNEIVLNSHPLESSTIRNGVGYAAAREIGRVIGATVEWAGETRTVRFQLPGQSEAGGGGTAAP